MVKPRKVEEPAAPYVADKSPASPSVPSPKAKGDAGNPTSYADNATFRKATAKVFKTHDELFRKLAK